MIKIPSFLGMLPKMHPRLLPDTAAQVCHNARIRSGALVPFRENSAVTVLPFAKASITKLNGLWQGWVGYASVVQGPTRENQIYISGDGVPKLYNAGNTYNLALPAPTSAPTLALIANIGTPDPENTEQIAFVHTLVTSLDEESAPSPLSAPIAFTVGQSVRLSNFGTVPSARLVNRRRIYRTVTDFAGNANLFFVAEIGSGFTTFDYLAASHPVVEPISTTNFDAPVADIQGFTTMPNGMVAGFKDRTLYFCEPYQLHAWPIAYSLKVDYPIVGLASFGPSLAVMTTGTPYVAQGSHPDNMVLTKIEQNLPCVAARGIVDLGYAAAYPSNDGLVSISSAGAQLVSQSLFSREVWQAMKPELFVAAQYEGRYAFIHQIKGGAAKGIGFIDLTGETPFYITTSSAGNDLFYEIETGKVFVLEADGVTITQFDGPTSAARQMTWRSKRFDTPMLTNFGAARLDVDGTGSSQAAIYGNGTLISTITGNNSVQRLKGGRLDDRFEIEITGTQEVSMFAMASGVPDLMG